jgi:Trk K+ transport system NAD-binding subunit
VLIQAGIERARSIIACADSDPQNIFITLTARELRADIPIVARAALEDSEKNLKRAGADRVISPYKASGTEMARLALHPQRRGVVAVDTEYRLDTDTVLLPGDIINAMGTPTALGRLESLFQTPGELATGAHHHGGDGETGASNH